MDNPGNTWKQHLLAIGFRCLCMAAITITGPLIGVDPQPVRPDGSEQAPGVAGLLFAIGLGAAMVFGLVTSILHCFFRRRPLKTILIADALIAAVVIVCLALIAAKA